MADAPNPIRIQEFLGGVDYPASKESLLAHAKDSGADNDVLNALPTRSTTAPQPSAPRSPRAKKTTAKQGRSGLRACPSERRKGKIRCQRK